MGSVLSLEERLLSTSQSKHWKELSGRRELLCFIKSTLLMSVGTFSSSLHGINWFSSSRVLTTNLLPPTPKSKYSLWVLQQLKVKLGFTLSSSSSVNSWHLIRVFHWPWWALNSRVWVSLFKLPLGFFSPVTHLCKLFGSCSDYVSETKHLAFMFSFLNIH